MKLSLIFPAYNEAAALPAVLGSFATHCARHNISYELIVVNDGSRDTTSHVVRDFVTAHPTTQLVEHQTNRGYGAALRSGFAAATGDFVFFTDSDGQFQPEDLNQTISLLRSNRMVVGYRYPRHEGRCRRFNAWAWGQLVGRWIGGSVRDLGCAWKAFPRSWVTTVKLRANGAFLNAELLYQARRSGLEVVELPVHHWPRQSGSATGANPLVIARAFWELLMFIRDRR